MQPSFFRASKLQPQADTFDFHSLLIISSHWHSLSRLKEISYVQYLICNRIGYQLSRLGPTLYISVLLIEKSGFNSSNQDVQISYQTENLKTDSVADLTNSRPISGRISIHEIRDKIGFQILRLIGNPKIQSWKSMSGRISVSEIRGKILFFKILCSIGNLESEILRSKSGFLNRAQHYAINDNTSVIVHNGV